jgi:Tfp pilus assembly protein PilF
MDGRWKLVVAGGMLAGAFGWNTTPKQPGDQLAQAQAAKAQQIAKAPPQPVEPPRTSLKPATYVSMGGLTEQAANEQERPQAERDAFRHQARQSYQMAIKVDPKYAPAYVALGESYMAGGERDQAQAMFKKATEVAPTDAGVWSELGAAQARCKDWPAAVASLNRAVQLDPGNKPLETRLGLTLARAGKYEDSLNALAKVMPEAEARYNVARMMRHNQQNDAADVQLQLALRADPEFQMARDMLADRGPTSGGIQQASLQQPAPAPPTIQSAPTQGAVNAAPPRLSPIQLGGSTIGAEPVPINVNGIER